MSQTTAFDLPSHKQWEAAALATARADSLRALATTTLEGLVIDPLYTAAGSPTGEVAGLPGSMPYTRGATAASNRSGWQVRADLALSSDDDGALAAAESAAGVDAFTLRRGWTDHRAALLDLLGGSTSDTANPASGTANNTTNPVPIYLQPGASIAEANALIECLATAGIPVSTARGSLGLDPLGAAMCALANKSTTKPDDLTDTLLLTADYAASHTTTTHTTTAHPTASHTTGLRSLALDGTAYSATGAGDTYELAAVLANATQWLDLLIERGCDLATAAAQIEFTLSATAEVFTVVAKCRALRTCWARVLQVCGDVEAVETMSLHVCAANSMMSLHDPWTNMLRSTTACFAASLGGADAVTLPPFDGLARPAQAGNGSDLGRSVARNTQLILLHESQINAVLDPAGGSWFVENLTEQLADRAWQGFTQIVAEGGLPAAIGSGKLAASVAKTAHRRRSAVATQRQVLVGVNAFTYLDESDAVANSADEAIGYRWAEPFEQLRNRSATLASAAITSTSPTVFLAALGPSSDNAARTNFAKTLFEAGGIAAPVPTSGYDSPAEAVAAFAGGNASLACICSSDVIYASQAAETAAGLRAAGARRIYLVGTPGDDETAWRAAGVDEFVFVGCDMLAVLAGAHESLTGAHESLTSTEPTHTQQTLS